MKEAQTANESSSESALTHYLALGLILRSSLLLSALQRTVASRWQRPHLPQFARLTNELQRDEDDARIGVGCVTVQERL
jgi:hypothetical protein